MQHQHRIRRERAAAAASALFLCWILVYAPLFTRDLALWWLPTTTVASGVNRGNFKIQVANASGIAGSAGDLSNKLTEQNYVVQPALNTAPGTAKREKTGVFYMAGCEAAAQDVAAVLGGNVEIGAMPSPVPLETGNLGEACVLLVKTITNRARGALAQRGQHP